MDKWTREDLEIDRCTSCGGLFLDKGELEEVDSKNLGPLIDIANDGGEKRDAVGEPAHCYRCDVPMTPLTGADDIEFDWCDQCEGMFFDPGELARFDIFEA